MKRNERAEYTRRGFLGTAIAGSAAAAVLTDVPFSIFAPRADVRAVGPYPAEGSSFGAFVMGDVREVRSNTLTVAAAPRGADLVTVQVNDATQILHWKVGGGLPDVRIGDRVDLYRYTAADGSSIAKWLNVNSWGGWAEVQSVSPDVVVSSWDMGAATKRGMPPLRLHITPATRVQAIHGGEVVGQPGPLRAGDYTFFTACSRGPEVPGDAWAVLIEQARTSS